MVKIPKIALDSLNWLFTLKLLLLFAILWEITYWPLFLQKKKKNLLPTLNLFVF